ncbi:hypothetical protein Goshw_028272, partial [Gossypium schwendimanii]|nr:hypothetical protein [Gossypium schwendimanii]
IGLGGNGEGKLDAETRRNDDDRIINGSSRKWEEKMIKTEEERVEEIGSDVHGVVAVGDKAWTHSSSTLRSEFFEDVDNDIPE